MLQDTTDSESKSTITVVQEVQPPLIPDDAHVMTVLINHPPGAPGYHPSLDPTARAFRHVTVNAEIHLLDGGHFLLETACDTVAELHILGHVGLPARHCPG